MDKTESTLKKIQEAKEAIKKRTAGREDELREVCSAAGRMVGQTVLQRYLAEKAKRAGNPFTRALFSLPSGALGSCASRWNLVLSLAEAIDRFSEAASAELPEAEPIDDEAEFMTFADVGDIPAEPAVAAFAETAEASGEDEEADDGDDEDTDAFGGIDTSGLEFISVADQPDAYKAMLAQEAAGEVKLIHRYRRSFTSRLVQSRGNAQEYYNALKNALLSYKGVKSRISWGQESFNKGREKLAKINVKNKTVYLYLAISPDALSDSKYFFEDVSDKKKYEDVPVLFKIKGERKFAQALELIEKVCAEQLQLPPVKDFEPDDYTIPYLETEELVQAGYIKQYTAALPLTVVEPVPPVGI